ncbi:ribbon-helix-helix protein, CopG family [Demequina lutea]|uniref:2,3-bisphosphoglycerate-independent phosphoglycerate mutase n=1 Tax=Demequina lutea TaxID=431489 RepID=A0A7Y9ZD00_9MICO|nr:ribbon-helix-helix protein, CopG family [Demequina lutea]NYI42605.1 2,3-bisphosphoglycerate-independent phosphoglycerate mutase [Demequina lutea]
MTPSRDTEAARFAAEPESWGEPQGGPTGADAAAHGRALLEAAGVDVAAVERRVGRPRIGGTAGRKGERSARVNVAVTDAQAAIIDRLVGQGRTRSDIVREALDEYLAAREFG